MKPLAFLNRERLSVGVVLGSLVAALLVLASASNLFAATRLRLSDVYFIPQPASDQIVLVALDDASLEAYGRSLTSWRRSLYADLVARVSRAGARVVAFDILFADASGDDDLFAEAMRQAREAEGRTRFVLAAAGLQTASQGEASIRYENLLLPTEELASAADYIGYINVFPDADGVIRRQPSQLWTGDQPSLAFSLATYLAYLRIPAAAASQVITRDGDRLYVTPERALPVDALGIWVQHYFTSSSASGSSSLASVSLVDLLEGRADDALFADKIVLVGSTATGSTDRYFTPFNPLVQMSGVEIQANAVETLLQNRALVEQSRLNEVLLVIGLALASSVVYAQLRWYLIVPVAAGLALVALLFAFWNFSARLEIVHLFYPLLAVLLPAASMLALNISIEARRRQRSEFLLQSVLQVSGQQLALTNILPYLAADVRQILAAQRGVICIPDAADQLQAVHRWGDGDMTELEQMSRRVKAGIWVEGGCVSAPVLWQGRLLATLAAELPPGRTPSVGALALLRDLTQQIAPALDNAALYAEVSQQKSLLEAVLLGSPEAVFVLDTDLKVLMQNPGLATALQTPLPDDATLPALLDAVGFDPAERDELSERFAARQPFRQQVQIGRKTFNLDAALLPAHDRWVVILSDITTLVELNDLKTRMIRMASHDLKNPLSRVMGYAEMVLEVDHDTPSLQEVQRRFIKSIIAGAEAMRQIITDILSLEQLRSGSIRREQVNMSQLIHAAAAPLEEEAAAYGHQFEVELTDEPLIILGDSAQLTQMIVNLVGNAIKYTPNGGQIRVLLRREGDNAHFEVKDNGVGISAEAQKKLFTEFYRVRTRQTAHIEGTGLGLSLVRAVVEVHEGRIWLDSEEGVGSTFYVELPISQ